MGTHLRKHSPQGDPWPLLDAQQGCKRIKGIVRGEFGCKKIEGVPKMNSSDPSLLPWEPKVFNLESGQHPDVTLAPLKSLAECLDAQQGCKKIKGIPNMSSSDPLLLPLEPGVKDER